MSATRIRGREPIYPWRNLAIGDSFEWPKTVWAARDSCKKRKKRFGERYSVVKVREHDRCLIRVRRLA